MRIGLNGAGRIGRTVVRALLAREVEVELVAINDLATIDNLAYLLAHDSVRGQLGHRLEVQGQQHLALGPFTVRCTAAPSPAVVDWTGVDLVIEATGRFTDAADARLHLRDDVTHVIVTAPSLDADATIVVGYNDASLDGCQTVISTASCTTNCLVQVLAVLDAAFGIEAGLVTTVHSYTADQALTDRPHRDQRRGRAAGINIVPTTTGAAIAAGLVVPHLADRLDGRSLRVPIPDVSMADISMILGAQISVDDLNEALEGAAASSPTLALWRGPVVSSDVLGANESAVVDADLTQVIGRLAKVFAWYDNEWAYANRVVDVIERLASMESAGPPITSAAIDAMLRTGGADVALRAPS